MNTTLMIRITLRGRLSERLGAAFDGLTPVSCPRATQLVGEVADQAQLHGVLARIRDLGLELESVSVSRPMSTADRAAPSPTEAAASESAGRSRIGIAPDAHGHVGEDGRRPALRS